MRNFPDVLVNDFDILIQQIDIDDEDSIDRPDSIYVTADQIPKLIEHLQLAVLLYYKRRGEAGERPSNWPNLRIRDIYRPSALALVENSKETKP